MGHKQAFSMLLHCASLVHPAIKWKDEVGDVLRALFSRALTEWGGGNYGRRRGERGRVERGVCGDNGSRERG